MGTATIVNFIELDEMLGFFVPVFKPNIQHQKNRATSFKIV